MPQLLWYQSVKPCGVWKNTQTWLAPIYRPDPHHPILNRVYPNGTCSSTTDTATLRTLIMCAYMLVHILFITATPTLREVTTRLWAAASPSITIRLIAKTRRWLSHSKTPIFCNQATLPGRWIDLYQVCFKSEIRRESYIGLKRVGDTWEPFVRSGGQVFDLREWVLCCK